MNLGYSSAKKLESARSKSFALSLSLKPRPSGVSLESPRVENILSVPGNRAEVDQNHHARNGLSAILSVLNLSRAIFRP